MPQEQMPAAPQEQAAEPQSAEDLVSQAFTALSELSELSSKTPGVPDSAKQNLKVSLKGLEAFVQMINDGGEQKPEGSEILPEHAGNREVLPA